MNSTSFPYWIICSTLKKANCILQYLLSNMPNEMAERTNYFCSQAGWILFLGYQKDCWCKSSTKSVQRQANWSGNWNHRASEKNSGLKPYLGSLTHWCWARHMVVNGSSLIIQVRNLSPAHDGQPVTWEKSDVKQKSRRLRDSPHL